MCLQANTAEAAASRRSRPDAVCGIWQVDLSRRQCTPNPGFPFSDMITGFYQDRQNCDSG